MVVVVTCYYPSKNLPIPVLKACSNRAKPYVYGITVKFILYTHGFYPCIFSTITTRLIIPNEKGICFYSNLFKHNILDHPCMTGFFFNCDVHKVQENLTQRKPIHGV